jgi:endoglucanase
MANAFELTGKRIYLNGVTESVDYIMGRNALCKSFVSGYGENPFLNPHHRYWANEEESGFPPPPSGVLSGGPNEDPKDEPALKLINKPRAKRYIDHIDSYSTNEVTINWNAPLAWIAFFLNEKYN